MEKRRQFDDQQLRKRIESVRRIYSCIGEPLPADILIDLHLHLGGALAAAQFNGVWQKKKGLKS